MSFIVRKLRLQRGWTQDQLAEFAGISVRSVQRVERGAGASLESLKSLAAVFEVDVNTLRNGDETMTDTTLATDEKEALDYVKGIREFYMHLFMFAVFAAAFPLLRPAIRVRRSQGTLACAGIRRLGRGTAGAWPHRVRSHPLPRAAVGTLDDRETVRPQAVIGPAA